MKIDGLPAEPYQIKVVETVKMTTREEGLKGHLR